MGKLIAFHGKTSIRAEYIARVKAHAAADEIIQGKYWENGKGCAVGCTIHGSNHADYEKVLGIPQVLAHLEDRIFEGLQNGESKKFPLQFLSAIKPGADLSMVGPKLLLAIQKRNLKRLDAKAWSDQVNAIKLVISLYSDFIVTGKMDKSAARFARSAARSAAWSAARSAESARSAEYSWMARELLKLLKKAPVVSKRAA